MTTQEASPRPHLTWTKGGSASFVAAKDDMVTLASSIPSPPGSRLEGTLAAPEGAPEVPVKVKIHRSKKTGDDVFVLEGRLVDFTREVRERIHTLAAAFTPSAR